MTKSVGPFEFPLMQLVGSVKFKEAPGGNGGHNLTESTKGAVQVFADFNERVVVVLKPGARANIVPFDNVAGIQVERVVTERDIIDAAEHLAKSAITAGHHVVADGALKSAASAVAGDLASKTAPAKKADKKV